MSDRVIKTNFKLFAAKNKTNRMKKLKLSYIHSKINWHSPIDYITSRIKENGFIAKVKKKKQEFEGDRGFMLLFHISVFELLLLYVVSCMCYLFVYHSKTYCKIDLG